jgi:Glycogen recognition site of AMP-activated protein kinase
MKDTRRLELFRRYLDRDIDLGSARELEQLLAQDGAARAELDAYRKMISDLRTVQAPEPPTDFVARVMRALPAAPRRSFWRDVVLAPRLSLGAALGVAGLLAVTWFAFNRLSHPHMKNEVQAVRVEPAPPGVVPSRVLVRFVLPAKGAKHVKLAGDFNGWRTDDVELVDEKGDGVFTATVPLPAGHHSYLFNVDGNWVQDPAATSVPDGFGQQNSVLDL